MNSPLLQFERMTSADVERIMPIENDIYPFPWSEQIFHDCIRVGYHGWMAFQGHLLVGHAMISIAAGESHMLNLSIAGSEQNKGLGKYFVEFLVLDAQKHKAHTMLLEVRPSNSKAINCYNASGFNEIGRRKDYYPTLKGREDALLLARAIPQDIDS